MFGLATVFAAVALLAWGAWRRPAVALAAVLCMYGLKQWGQNSSPFLVEHRTIANYSVAAIVVLALLRMRLRSMPLRWQMSQPGVFGILLFCYAGLTLAWTPALDVALVQWSLQLPYILTFAVLAPLSITDVDDVKTASLWTIGVGGSICVLALLFGTWGLRGLEVIGNSAQTETNPLAIASLGGTVFIMALLVQHAPVPRLLKLLSIPMTIAGLGVILRSGSRGQLVAAALAAVVGWLIASRGKSIGALLGVGIVGGALVGIGMWLWGELGVASARWTTESSSADVTGRVELALTLIAQAASNPATLLFGLGSCSAFFYIGGYPHISALEVIAEEGLLGTGLYLAVLISGMRSAMALIATTRRQGNNDQQAELLRYATALITALLLFEWILTLKQGTLLSSIYFVAYAAIVGRLALWKEGTADTLHGTEPSPTAVMPRFANLMR